MIRTSPYEIKIVNEPHPHAYIFINKNAMTCVLENACWRRKMWIS